MSGTDVACCTTRAPLRSRSSQLEASTLPGPARGTRCPVLTGCVCVCVCLSVCLCGALRNGRAYFLRATTEEMCNSWISDIKVLTAAYAPPRHVRY
eukprot:3565631-Rhodomonas_salina.2